MSSDLTGDKIGLKTVVAEEFSPEDERPDVSDTEQFDLLPLHSVHSPSETRNDTLSGPRGKGRPRGSKNKSTEEWRSFILGRYSSPLIGLAEIYSRSVKQLASEMGIEGPLTFDQAKQLLQLQKESMIALAPYVHGKMPTAIDAGDNGLIQLVIGGHTDASPKQIEDAPIDFSAIEIKTQENQGVTETEKQNSNANDSNATAKTHENTELEGNTPTD